MIVAALRTRLFAFYTVFLSACLGLSLGLARTAHSQNRGVNSHGTQNPGSLELDTNLPSINKATLGQSVQFQAIFGSNSGPAGTVDFYDGGTKIGSATLAPTPMGGMTLNAAVFTTSALTVGTHTITATYEGNATYAPASASLPFTVDTVTLTSSLNPSTYPQVVTFTATVTGSNPTGSVTFRDGTTVLSSPALSAGRATYPTGALSAGSHGITATYNGDANNALSAALVTQTVLAATTTTLAAPTSPSPYGAILVFTATVTASATGSVTFYDGPRRLATVGLGASQIPNATTTPPADEAVFGVQLALGAHSITAVYGGDANNASSTSSAVGETITQAATTTTVTSSANPSLAGNPVTFTATVTARGPGLTGTVMFRDGTTPLGTVPFASAAGTDTSSTAQATVTTSALAAGSHTITAAYSGDANFTAGTSAPLTQAVTPRANSQVALNATPNPARLGEPVTLTAMVLGFNTVPTGSVQFLADGVAVGGGSLAGRQSSFVSSAVSPVTLPAGMHSLTAVYGGDSNYTPGNSGSLPLKVGGVLHTFPAGLQWLAVTEDYAGVGLGEIWDAPQGQTELAGVMPPYQTVMPQAFAPGRAYLCDFLQPTSLYDTGVPVAGPFSLALVPGWNMISEPFPTSVPIGGLQVKSGSATYGLAQAAQKGLLSPVFWGADGTPHFAAAPSGNTLDPYQGYWAYSATNCQLIVTQIVP